jgi:hypothetical protein
VVRVGAVLALVAAVVIAAAALRPAAPELLVVAACDFAVMVDGALRCDDEAPRDVAALCGSEAGAAALAHGDAVTRAELCPAVTSGSPVPGGPGWGRMRGEDLEALAVPVDLNRATVEELESLPGIGPELARRIVEGRPYASVDALLRVRGIGPARLTAVRPRARAATPQSVP